MEDSGYEIVHLPSEQRGYKYAAEKRRVESNYEPDIYCKASAVTAVGEVKVRAGGRDVEKTIEKYRSVAQTTRQTSGRHVPVLHTPVAEPPAV